ECIQRDIYSVIRREMIRGLMIRAEQFAAPRVHALIDEPCEQALTCRSFTQGRGFDQKARVWSGLEDQRPGFDGLRRHLRQRVKGTKGDVAIRLRRQWIYRWSFGRRT